MSTTIVVVLNQPNDSGDITPNPIAIEFVIPTPSMTATFTPDAVAVEFTLPAPTVAALLTPDAVAVEFVLPDATVSYVAWQPFGPLTQSLTREDWAPHAIFRIQVWLSSPTASTVSARLRDTGDDSILAVVSSNAVSPESVISDPFILPSGTHEYVIDFGGETGAGPYNCYMAQIIVDRS